MRRRPTIWIVVALAIVTMLVTAIATHLINEREVVGVGILALITLIYFAGMTVAQKVGESGQARKRPIPMSQYVSSEAMRRAKYSAGQGRPTLRDIGILAYRDDGDPDVYRRLAVRGSARQLRPYVVLNRKGLLADDAELHFAIEDGAGKTCFEVKQEVRLVRGGNFFTSETWLPIQQSGESPIEVERDGRWRLTVKLDGVTMAEHPFRVKPVVRSELAGAISDDGEIEPESTIEWGDEPLSLKDLLDGDLAQVQGKSERH
jgi:hypothetical protein